MREAALPVNTGEIQGKPHQRPQPHPGIDLELARSVQRSMLELQCLLIQHRLAVATINGTALWLRDLRGWRERLWDILGGLLAAGFEPPDYMLDFDASPEGFIAEWRMFLAKV